eukprot:1967567-Pleurochrysis_carterae.AAC.2
MEMIKTRAERKQQMRDVVRGRSLRSRPGRTDAACGRVRRKQHARALSAGDARARDRDGGACSKKRTTAGRSPTVAAPIDEVTVSSTCGVEEEKGVNEKAVMVATPVFTGSSAARRRKVAKGRGGRCGGGKGGETVNAGAGDLERREWSRLQTVNAGAGELERREWSRVQTVIAGAGELEGRDSSRDETVNAGAGDLGRRHWSRDFAW